VYWTDRRIIVPILPCALSQKGKTGTMVGFMKKLTALSLFLTLCSFAPLSALSAASASGMQTVAGLGAEIACQSFAPNEGITARVLPPLGAIVTIHGTADAQGKASLNLGGEETQVAGPYAVETDGKGSCSSFTVLPETIDSARAASKPTTPLSRPTASPRRASPSSCATGI